MATPIAQVPDVAGTWEIDETLNDNCGDRSSTASYVATVTQSGSRVSVTYGGITRDATMEGNVLRWSGSYEEAGGTTTVSSLVLTFSGNTASGTAQWSWTDGTDSCSGTSSISAARIDVSVPATPSNLNAVATSSGSVDLMWQDNADNEDNYFLERSVVSATSDFVVVAVMPSDRQSFSDMGLAPSTTYYYRVYAANSNGQSGYSEVVTVTTEGPPAMPPAAPSNLNGSPVSSTSVQLFWSDNSVDESGFEVLQALGPGGSFNLATSVAADVTSATINGLTPGTNYAFKVVAVNSAGRSIDSNVHEIETPADLTVPNPPTDLAVDNETSSSLTVRWTDQSSNEAGFRVYRAADRDGSYTEIAVLPASSTSYTNTGLTASTTYWYRVSAFNAAGASFLSAPVSGTTLAPPVSTPSAPSGLVVGAATSSTLTLTWVDNSEIETGYRVYRATSARGAYSEVATTTASQTRYIDTGLSPETTYWYRLTAFNSAGESPEINPVDGTTLAPPVSVPAAPSDPDIQDITANSATLSWSDNADNETGFQLGTCSGFITVSSNDVVSCQSGFNQFDQVGSNTTTYALNGLQANTRYDIFVRAFNSAGNSANTGVRFTTAPGAQTVTLSAIATNTVVANSMDGNVANTVFANSAPGVGINWGSTLAGEPSSVAFAGLVRYDLSSIQGRTILSATLNLEAASAPVGFLPQNFDIGTVATAWSPSIVTWNQVADFFYYTAGWQRNIAYPTFAGATYSVDMTSVVQNWANGVFENHGIGFFSSNYAAFPGNTVSLDAYTFFVPTLTVTYE